MNRSYLCGICLCLLLSTSFAEGKKMRQVILLGDSIRLGYQNDVKHELAGAIAVWSPEENCQDSVFIIKKIDSWLNGKDPDVIYLNCGLHDIFLDQFGKCRRSVEDYGKNLDIIFQGLRTTYPRARIIFALTTPVDEEKQISSKTYGRLVRKNSDVARYNAQAVESAQKHNIITDDLYRVVDKAGVNAMLIDDGVHLNDQAVKILGRHVASKILQVIK